jgi:hypothetical protein
MKTVILLFVVIILLAACSSPKKTTTKAPSPRPTRTDVFRGGTSFSNAVVIMVETESAGLKEEYKWLSNNYPGYGLIKKTHVTRSSKHYDIMRIKTRDGHLKTIYFDTTHFWGKI